jgi:cell division protein FtsA
MEEIIDAVNFEIQNSGYADKLAAGVVITGGGAMLKNLVQLMNFKTAMSVRIGLPNEHLAGSARNEINQPMYATSVGLIMRGFDYLETYKKSFRAGSSEEYTKPKASVVDQNDEEGEEKSAEKSTPPAQEEGRISIKDRIIAALTSMFEVDDHSIVEAGNQSAGKK